MSRRVGVIGTGAWGTALAQAARAAGHQTTLYGRDQGVADEITTRHSFARALPGVALDPELRATTDMAGLAAAEIVLVVVAAQATRSALSALAPDALAGKPVVLCAKGLEAGSARRQSEVLAETAPAAIPFVLSGPSFADDVARGRPTAVTLAGPDVASAEAMAAMLAGPFFRPYSSADIVGVELAGALKNVYALGAGTIDGAGLGLSARSAFLARAYAEMGRLILATGGSDATLGGLAGIGDLALSCTSDASRNYRFGIELGRGRSVADIRGSALGLAEGVFTAPVARTMAARTGVDVPLVDAVNLILEGETPLPAILENLMARPLKREGGD